ncbi:PhnA domain-containing protein [Dyadobacter sp. MSC1_007]|jgi:protein PhnA|uniref:PhnA domain-containing protein n=1 Tax=Dyadobacter sp. MSC1_007 TaxID=2909264 RepID=UPI00202DE1ED|nr:alkylphosphonate utilization protein [Dyadobacter sp. MSC1_007]
MNLKLEKRSGNACELCKSDEQISVYTVPPLGYADNEIVICKDCSAQIERDQQMNSDYWGFLSETIWSEVPAVQIVAWRMLSRLKNESWAADNLDMMYLDQDMLAWAQASSDHQAAADLAVHRDSNGNILKNGDSVVLTKSLDIKGSSLNAKMGTVVKNIRVVEGNTAQIEGKIDGQLIVILTKYLRKQG